MFVLAAWVFGGFVMSVGVVWGMRKDSPHRLVFTRFYSSPVSSALDFTTLQLDRTKRLLLLKVQINTKQLILIVAAHLS